MAVLHRCRLFVLHRSFSPTTQTANFLLCRRLILSKTIQSLDSREMTVKRVLCRPAPTLQEAHRKLLARIFALACPFARLGVSAQFASGRRIPRGHSRGEAMQF